MSSPGKGTDVQKRSSADVQVKNLKKCFDDNKKVVFLSIEKNF